jgi:hypothetical protein
MEGHYPPAGGSRWWQSAGEACQSFLEGLFFGLMLAGSSPSPAGLVVGYLPIMTTPLPYRVQVGLVFMAFSPPVGVQPPAKPGRFVSDHRHRSRGFTMLPRFFGPGTWEAAPVANAYCNFRVSAPPVNAYKIKD